MPKKQGVGRKHKAGTGHTSREAARMVESNYRWAAADDQGGVAPCNNCTHFWKSQLFDTSISH